MFKHFAISFILLVLLDFAWFQYSVKNLYQPTFEAIQKSPFRTRMMGGLVAWLLIALGVSLFSVTPGQPLESLKKGALLGLVIYGVYNGTMYATLIDYPIKTSVIDTLWGTLAVGATSLAVSYF